ncbi:FAD-dependent monooxygenase [Salinigranum salinum]|uniref:FAD-dependent monooxygenase n=1 Tax=Salinigranum salinum TaxID=1364937 RepID=UPI001260FEEE|nr:FAD-dependent monooxygenase [Salinigranum salinum]
MTLATIPRYDDARIAGQGGRAVVVGAGVAGLLAARVLADAFAAVTVIDRDRLPETPIARRGVPQGRHPHAMLESGRATIEDLLPGYGADVVAAGGVVTDYASDVQFYGQGRYLAAGPASLETVSATRPLFEHVLRRHVSALDAVEIRSNCQWTDYRLDDTATAVEGVTVREDGDREALPAELVVDASGRTSRTPAWLAKHGYPTPRVDEVRIDMAYSTTFVERPPDDHRTYLVPPSSPRYRGGMAAPVESGRWILNLQGVHGETPPTDDEAFSEYAASLPVPEIRRLLADYPWATEEIVAYPFPSSRRHHYEALDRFPDGLLVVGDALASFNPVYAQGMSVTALEALVLHHALAAGQEDLASRFFDRTAAVVDTAWSLATGADFGFAETRGPRPRGTTVVNWYLSRLLRQAHTDGTLTDAFVRVLMMERPPTALFRPGVVWRVLKPTGVVRSREVATHS